MVSLCVSVLSILSLCIVNINSDVLILTPYIEHDSIREGQIAALVPSLNNDNIRSFSGFLTVNRKYGSHMFFWFFPAEIDNLNAPLILWLQGGPGRSSLYGLFEQNGPYYINKNEELKKRDHYWSKMYNILYIDNPVGTGFSFTRNDDGYSRNETDIGINLYECIKQFFNLFPEYIKNDFYIAGSSYAGKYIPALAYIIDKYKNNTININLKGLIIGNGYYDPKTIINRSELLYEIGLIDLKFKKQLDIHINNIVNLINEKKYLEALDYEENIMREAVLSTTGYRATFNYLNDTLENPFGDLVKFITNNKTRDKIHVGQLSFKTYDKVVKYLRNDIMKSVKIWMEYLLERYKILIYTGQLDLIVTYSATVKFIQSLNWTAAEQYRNAERKLWYVDNELAGYNKTAGKLTEVLVRNAGHSAIIDKPKFILKMIEDFINI